MVKNHLQCHLLYKGDLALIKLYSLWYLMPKRRLAFTPLNHLKLPEISCTLILPQTETSQAVGDKLFNNLIF